ncbi:MAG: oligosaccharide flippase family protein [Clostridia bacterium]|nr:oligosaccharide flippase family protein [Clostridia bacterium]
MRKFLKTVAIVTVFSVCEKFLGFLYRIYLSRTIGAEGIGLYQVALSVFSLLFTITCSGTPITVSRLITKYKAENKDDRISKVITAGLLFTVLVAIPVCLIFFIFSKSFTFLFADERCINIFLIILPGLIFTSVYAVLRGVFWGTKDFLPYSIIELLEELCMIVAGIILIHFATDVYQGAYRAGVAVLISYLFSFTLASIVFFVRKNKLKNPKNEFKPLLKSALPITAMRTANSLAVSLVSIILPMRLILAGFTESQAMSTFGAAVGQAIPLLFIPTTLIGSFTLVLVPEISENFYKKRDFYLQRDVEKALKFTIFLTCLFIPVFFVCGEEIGMLVFHGHECGKYITASAFLMLFMSLSSITTSILNSMGFEHKTLIFYIISGVFMLLSIWFLPQFIGIYSLLVGFTFIYGLTTALNLILLNKHCKRKPKYLKFLLSAVSLLIPSVILGAMLEKMLLPILGTFFTFIFSAGAMVVFNAALYVGFGLVEFKFLRSKIKSVLSKKHA